VNINQSNWIVHHLTFPELVEEHRIYIRGASDLVIDSNLVEQCTTTCGTSNYSAIGSVGSPDSDGLARITVQHNVVRNRYPTDNTEGVGIAIENGEDIHIVSNEIYDYSAHPIQVGNNNGPEMPGIVVENNDVYFTSALYTNGGQTMGAKAPLTIKATACGAPGGASCPTSNPIRILHNRVWGARWTDSDVCCTVEGAGGGQKAISVTPRDTADGQGNNFVQIQDNITFDSQIGIQFSNGFNYNASIVGNLLYKLKRFYAGVPESTSHALSVAAVGASEIYNNTVINEQQFYIEEFGRGNNEFLCNVFINGGNVEGSALNGNTVDANVFYATTPHTSGSNNLGNFAINTRANSQPYAIDDLIVVGDPETCSSSTDANCFMYKVVTAGTSAGSAPAYCTTLGCTTTDGGMIVKAIRGPYAFFRKLLTGPEQYFIPYAAVDSSAPEAGWCPSIGGTTGIGINNDTSGNGILAVDLRNASRAGTAGALEASSGQAGSDDGTPFSGSPVALPGTVEAENFNVGTDGQAYHDTNGTNGGGAYRNTGVDIEANAGSSNGNHVCCTFANEWLKYAVNVSTSGTYLLEVNVASAGNGGTFHIEFGGFDKTGAIVIPDTGGWTTWQTLTRNVTLTAGAQTMRIVMDANGATGSVGNIDFVRLTAE
jgi:hypothetical protein